MCVCVYPHWEAGLFLRTAFTEGCDGVRYQTLPPSRSNKLVLLAPLRSVQFSPVLQARFKAGVAELHTVLRTIPRCTGWFHCLSLGWADPTRLVLLRTKSLRQPPRHNLAIAIRSRAKRFPLAIARLCFIVLAGSFLLVFPAGRWGLFNRGASRSLQDCGHVRGVVEEGRLSW